MRHRKNKKILGRHHSHRQALLRNLAASFLTHGKIKTTEAKAKLVRPLIEKVITIGKTKTLPSRRRIIALLGTPGVAQRVLTDVAPRYADRHGGYTRIIKIGQRRGDSARLVVLTLV